MVVRILTGLVAAGIFWNARVEPAWAQEYTLEVYTPDDGLASSQTHQILEDRRGFMWFACTGGISRFDGYTFTTFTVRDGLSHSSVRNMAVDEKGRLWVGTESGLNVLVPRGTAGSHVRQFPHLPTLGQAAVNYLLLDDQQRLWVATNDRGLVVLNTAAVDDSVALAQSVTVYGESKGLTRESIRYLYRDRRSTLWIATDAGLYALDGSPGHFSRFTRSSGLLSDQVQTVVEDDKDRLWIGSSHGVNFMDLRTRKITSSYLTNHEGLPGLYVQHILKDRRGRIWVATRDGAVRYESDEAPSLALTRRNGLSDPSVQHLCEDHEGRMWLATDGGVNHLKNEQFVNYRVEDGLPSKLILCLERGVGRDLWIGTLNGLSRFDGRRFHIFTRSDGLVDNAVWVVRKTRAGPYWIGTESGISYGVPGQGPFLNRTRVHGLTGGRIHDIVEDESGFIWIASTLGLSMYDPRSDSFQNYTIDNGLPINYVRSLFIDRRHRIWLGTRGAGLCLVLGHDRSSIRLQIFNTAGGFPDNTIGRISESPGGDLWVATHAGAVLFDPDADSVLQHITVKEGLAHNLLSAILPDDEGKIWICGDKGVDVVDPQSRPIKVVQHFGKSSGMIAEEFSTNNSVLPDSAGEFWFGTVGGLVHYRPVHDGTDTVAPRMYLYYMATTSGDGKGSSFDLLDETPAARVLSHDQNSVTFAYAGLSYSSSRDVRYRYKLEGFDKDWSAWTVSREIRYTNLPAGEYTFNVQCISGTGAWSERPARVRFHIEPAIWESWWFRTLSVLGLMLVAYAVYRYRLRTIEGRNRELELKIKQRTVELEEKNRQLKELNQVKDEFLHIAAHDLRNPLNSILSTSRIILDETRANTYQTEAYLTEDTELIHRASEHMLDLINNLLDIAKIESGKVALEMEQYDLVGLIKEQIEEMRWIARKKDIRIEFAPGAPNLPALCDREKMWQILSNLLSNALKFTDHGGTIRVLAARTDEGTVVSVQDNGRGIPTEAVGNVFNKFSNLSRVGTDGERGTGLGLAITKKLVELHGGRIWLDASSSFGACFSFLIPHHLPREHKNA
jgi:signal transduction histidine kinase/ligand-binding sensor domain-containing protein